MKIEKSSIGSRLYDMTKKLRNGLVVLLEPQLMADKVRAGEQVAHLQSELSRLSEGFRQLQSSNEQLQMMLYGATATRQPADESEVHQSILLVTLPKSATVYIYKTLQESLGLAGVTLSYGHFPSDILSPRVLSVMGQGGVIGQTHADASPMNLQLLRYYRAKILVHLRDPRAAMLSWVHHLARLKREGHEDMIQMVCPAPGADYFSKDLNWQINWNLEHYFPLCLEWISSWLRAAQNDGEIMVKAYEDFLQSNAKYFAELLEFYGYEPHRPMVEIPKTMKYHFRKGSPDEWRDVYGDELTRKATSSMPTEWFERFPWRP